MAEQIEVAKKHNVTKMSKELGDIISFSCLTTCAIALANITDQRDFKKQSIHLNYLFDYAAGMPSAFPRAPKGSSVEKIVDGYKKLYSQYEPTVKKVNDQRDQILAHVDKELLNNPRLYMDNPITADELRNIYAFLHTMIYAFAGYLNSNDNIPTFDSKMSRKLRADFSLMIS